MTPCLPVIRVLSQDFITSTKQQILIKGTTTTTTTNHFNLILIKSNRIQHTTRNRYRHSILYIIQYTKMRSSLFLPTNRNNSKSSRGRYDGGSSSSVSYYYSFYYALITFFLVGSMIGDVNNNNNNNNAERENRIFG
mmetsp:Transcript_38516/g.41778  ORF Transcript_38516/g.41778 Transcript_38516/m.41778 type:complete len:137 (+) Transcript_38516:450-860(+)